MKINSTNKNYHDLESSFVSETMMDCLMNHLRTQISILYVTDGEKSSLKQDLNPGPLVPSASTLITSTSIA